MVDFSKNGYPGGVGQTSNVCNTNYPLAVKQRDAGWMESDWDSYTKTIYSSNPPYAASIKQYCNGAKSLVASLSVAATLVVSL